MYFSKKRFEFDTVYVACAYGREGALFSREDQRSPYVSARDECIKSGYTCVLRSFVLSLACFFNVLLLYRDSNPFSLDFVPKK